MGRMTKKAVFFDFGGTLLVMRRDRIISQILSEEGYRTTPEEVRSAYLKAEPQWLLTLGDQKESPSEMEESYRRLDTRVFDLLFPGRSIEESERMSGLMRSRWGEVQQAIPLELYPDVLPTLKSLRKDGHPLAIVSNAPPETMKTIEELGLPALIPAVVVSGVVGVSKPNPEIFRIALRSVGVRAEDAVHVGDLYEADVVGARNAGIEGVLIDRDGMHDGMDCPRVSTLGEIYRFLR
jgi:HAD superfamily hydrolase (TIGR01549 family)